jgi:hypothetical protein
MRGPPGRSRVRLVVRRPTAALAIAILVASVAAAAAYPNLTGQGATASSSPPAFTTPTESALASSSTDGPPIGNWTEQTDYGSAFGANGSGGMPILGQSCVSNSTYIYCVGGQNLSTGVDISDVFYANLSSDGLLGPWVETTDYGASSGAAGSGGVGIEFASCVEYSGYVYCVAGALSASPFTVSKVFYAPISSTGVGGWIETTDYGATSSVDGSGGIATFELSCTVSAGYIYCVGGGTSKVFFAQLSGTGVGPWTETTDYGAASGTTGTGGKSIASVSCASATGELYCVGGTISFSPVSRVYYAPVSASGVGAWSESTDYGASSGTSGSGGIPIYSTACFAPQGIQVIVCADGDTTGNTGTDYVTYANLTSGGVGPWTGASAFGDAPVKTYHLGCAMVNALKQAGCGGGGEHGWWTAPVCSESCQHPLLTTQLSTSTAPVGSEFYDTASLNGQAANAGGFVVYQFYKGADDSNIQAQYATLSVPVINGVVQNSPAVIAHFSVSGYNVVQAFYTGDSNDSAIWSAPELLSLTQARPTVATTLSTSSATVGQSFTDSATLQGATSTAGGTLTYRLYADGVCGNVSGQSDDVTVSNGSVPNSALFTAVASTSGYISVQAFYEGDPANLPATSPCERLAISSGGSTSAPPGPSPFSIAGLSTEISYAVLVGIAVAVIAAVLGVLLLRRRGDPPPGGEGEPPPPPGTPPAGTIPPPVPVTVEKEMCDLRAGVEATEPSVEVVVSERADSSYKGKGSEIKEAIEEKVRNQHVFSSVDWGVAIAASDGASVGGSVAAGSILSTLGGTKTEKIEARNEGNTTIYLSITAPEGARTKISASVLTAVEADASVLEVPEDLWEQLEIESWISLGTETVIRIVSLEEWVEKFESITEKTLSVVEKAELLKELRIWRKALVAALKDPRSAAKNIKILIRNLYRITRKYGGEKILKIWEFSKFIVTEGAAVAVEKIGNWLLVNADVEVLAKGWMDFEIGECEYPQSKIEVDARRHLEVEDGDFKEPSDKRFERKDVRSNAGTCTAESEMTIKVWGDVGVEGSAKYDGDGYANLNSLWAVAWVLACEHGAPGDAGYLKEQESGYRWGAWFKVPDEVRAQFPSDTTLADTAAMRNYVTVLLDEKLKTLISETFEGTQYSPLDSSTTTESKLKAVLEEWYKYVQEKVGLFEPPGKP